MGAGFTLIEPVIAGPGERAGEKLAFKKREEVRL
jgi:hypothetical protein